MGLAAEMFGSEGEDFYQCDKCATAFEDKDVADNCCSACYACGYTDHVGFERGQKCCPCNCDETGGGPDGTCQEMFGSETTSFCADCGYRSEEEGCGCGSMSAEMEYAELGEELYPVVPNSEGGNTALDSGYGVPQWYGSAEMDAQSITETLEEASPAKGTLVAPAFAALAGIVAGVFYARRK